MVRSDWTPHRVVAVIAYAIVGVCLIILFVQNARQSAFDDRRAADIAAANAETVKCVVKAIRADATQTKELRRVAQMRDNDLVASVKAMMALVQVRVLDGVDRNAQTVQAGNQFLVQGQNFVDQSEKLDQAREENKVPDTICGVVIE